MNNFLDLNWFSTNKIDKLINLANYFKEEKIIFEKRKDHLACLLFLEPSTRTQLSFTVAFQKLGIKTINFPLENSALKKGETLFDTLQVLKAIGVTIVVIRSNENNFYENLKISDLIIINAGDGTNAHPSQALLDLMTIKQAFKTVTNKQVLIAGDIKHSRVAFSNLKVLSKYGLKIKIYEPIATSINKYSRHLDFNNLAGFDVIILLRNQFERHKNVFLNTNTYLTKHGLTWQRLQTLKKEAIVMHPGPFNRGLEIDPKVLNDQRVKINQQVENGVYARMAIIKYCIGELNDY